MNDTTRDEPMAGLAEWLEAESLDAKPRTREKLLRWKSEVESRRAACSGLPDGPVLNEVGVRVDVSPDALRAVADRVAEVFGPARRGAEKAALIRNAAFLLDRLSLPDGGAAERAYVDQRVKGLRWPEGYCLDPNGKVCVPAGKDEDFSFGYDLGYADGLMAQSAALAAPSAQPPVPEGWQLVPKKMTVEMARAASDERLDHLARPSMTVDESACRVWEAALRASPSAQPSGAPEVQPPRFFLDHGMWHDRETGQHLYTEDQHSAALEEVWQALQEEGIERNGWISIPEAIKKLATAPTPSGAPADTTKDTNHG